MTSNLKIAAWKRAICIVSNLQIATSAEQRAQTVRGTVLTPVSCRQLDHMFQQRQRRVSVVQCYGAFHQQPANTFSTPNNNHFPQSFFHSANHMKQEINQCRTEKSSKLLLIRSLSSCRKTFSGVYTYAPSFIMPSICDTRL